MEAKVASSTASVLASTITLHSPFTVLPSSLLLAVMVHSPAFLAVTSPASLTVATVSSELLQVTSLTVALSGAIVTVKVSVSSTLSVLLAGDTVIPMTATLLPFAMTVISHLPVMLLPIVLAKMVHLPRRLAVTSPLMLTVAILASELLQITFSSLIAGSSVGVSETLASTSSVFVSGFMVMLFTSVYTSTSQTLVYPSCTPCLAAMLAVSLPLPSLSPLIRSPFPSFVSSLESTPSTLNVKVTFSVSSTPHFSNGSTSSLPTAKLKERGAMERPLV